ncbi:Transcriptional corepressor SEUSS [Linum perenne]
MSRQSSHSAAAQFNLLHQQRLLQLQQHQQQQLLKAMPQQRSQLPQQSPAKPVYEPGMCARRLTRYMYQQQHRPEDNNIEFWRKFVAEYFAPNARKKWCVSMYGSGRQATGVFPQDVWHCEICNRKPGRGFEATVEVLPRLFKIKYESGTLEELLYVDMPHEYPNSSGQIVLDYAKAIQESVFEQLRVVRDGQLRIVFSPELKICSWEFCARRHEELIPRRLLIPQVSQLSAAAQKYQAATQNTSSSLSNQELLNNCNMFVQSARQLAKALEVPLISEVVNSMKDLVDYSRETGTGPMESLAKFPRRTSSSSGFNGRDQQSEPQQQPQPPPQPQALPSSSDPGSIHAGAIPYAGNSALAPSPGSSNTVPQAQQPNPSPFQSPTPSSSTAPQPALASDADHGDSQSSVQKILHEMMMSNQLNGAGGAVGVGAIGNDMKNVNSNGNLPTSNNSVMGSNSLMNGRMAMASMVREQAMNNQQQDLGNQLLSGLGAVNGFNNLQFDWKPSP